MHDMTAANLRSAFGGESMAHMRYKIWSNLADKEGFPNVARLFRAVSRAEQAHATGHFKAMQNEAGAFNVLAGGGFGYSNTSDALAGAIEGEEFEIHEMYPAYLAVAEAQDEKSAIRSMNYAISAEKIHAAMYTEAKQAVDEGSDYPVGTIQICTVCGHTLLGDEAPEHCPICNAKRERYEAFAAQ
ncbi:MAG: rubrerythrin family protein [Phycisphaerae bacterium]|jgi:rubrerythrin|nr:rubrerythrin family protein [Phycisphaerae bacterium]